MKLHVFCLLLFTHTEATQDAKIIIIGSGPSAIAAGSKLLENGFPNVILLEAEGRYGGRINTVPFGANVVDFGAQWCHGETGNAVYEIAYPLGALISTTARLEELSYVFSNGEELSPETGFQLLTLAGGTLEFSKYELKKFNGSLGGFMDQALSGVITPDAIDVSQETIDMFLEYFQKFISIYDAVDSWYDISAQSTFLDSPGDQFLNWKDRGYKTVLDILMKRYPDPSTDLGLEKLIELNKKVVKVDWSNDVVQVKCADGSSYTADHVISTVSVGVLKENFRMFKPCLPQPKRTAIDRIKFGTINKVFLEFKEPFWEKDFKGIHLLWHPKDKEAVRNGPDSWTEGFVAFFNIDFQPNVLCAFMYGKGARHMETLSEEEVQRGALLTLRRFLKDVPDPIRIRRSQWSTNPNFRGSYSYNSLQTKVEDRETLEEPLLGKSGKPRVLFGGEATNTIHYKCVHGAIETGWREAKRVIDYYGGKK